MVINSAIKMEMISIRVFHLFRIEASASYFVLIRSISRSVNTFLNDLLDIETLDFELGKVDFILSLR